MCQFPLSILLDLLCIAEQFRLGYQEAFVLFHRDLICAVIDPSMIKSHLHAEIPREPLRPFVIPAAIKPEKAPEIREPEYRSAVRLTSSLRVYHADIR